MFYTVSVLLAVCAVFSSASGPLPEEDFPPLGAPNAPPGPPGFHPGGPHSPPGPFPYPSSAHPDDFPPLGPEGDGPPVVLPGAWTRFPGPRQTSTYPRPDSPPPVPPRRRRPSHPQSHPPRSPSPTSDGPADGSYSHLTLSLQWHGGVCADGKSDDRPCIRESRRDAWTIHGLWPSNDFDSPSYCTRENFDGRRLEHVKNQLNQLWPSYTATQDRYFTFWRHQWQKHGTCAGDVPQLRGLVSFFENTLKLAKQHDIKKYLENSNIKPSKQQSYQPAQIVKAIADDFPYKFDVVCGDFKGQSVLSEVRFCFDKSLKPANCRGRTIRCNNQVYYLPVQ